MAQSLIRSWPALAISLALALPAYAAAPYYEGKTARIIVGFSAGGGFDTYSRLIARHLGKHIPGGPAIVVENMPGAASLVAANHVYNVAKPDGLTILNFHAIRSSIRLSANPASNSTQESSSTSASRPRTTLPAPSTRRAASPASTPCAMRKRR